MWSHTVIDFEFERVADGVLKIRHHEEKPFFRSDRLYLFDL